MLKRKAQTDTEVPGAVGQKILSPAKSIKRSHRGLIGKANSLHIEDFKENHIKKPLSYSPGISPSERTYSITYKAGKDLTNNEFESCFNLIKSTSRHDYESSSWGWHPSRKKREMKEDVMRYLLVNPAVTDTSPGTPGACEVEGFLSFMLTHDSTPSVPVLYVYEIHLSEKLQGMGLGRYLMSIAEGIAESVGVQKVMLTCFLNNNTARNFYKRRGYTTDVCSPEDRTTRGKVIKVDYVIMSRPVGGQPRH